MIFGTTKSTALLAASALAVVFSSPVYAQTATKPAPKMASVLKKWQMDKPIGEVLWVTRSVTEDRAVLENLVYEPEKFEKMTASRLVVTRQPGGAGDQFDIALENFVWVEPDGSRTTFAKLELIGLSDGEFLVAMPLPLGKTVNQIAAGDVRLYGFTNASKAKSGNLTTVRADLVAASGAELGESRFAIKRLEVQGVSTTSNDVDLSIANIALNDVSYSETSPSKLPGVGDVFDSASFNGFEFKLFQIDGVSMLLPSKAEEPTKKDIKASLARFEIADLTKGKLGLIGLSNLTTEGSIEGKPFNFSLASLALRDMNTAYFAALAKSVTKSIPPPNQDKTTSLMTPDTPKPGLVKKTNSSSVKAPAPPPSPPEQSPKLRDLLPGGPLDAGIGPISMGKLTATFQGAEFSIDQIEAGQARDANGIITKTWLKPMNMKFTFPEEMLQAPDGPLAAFAPFIADGLVLSARAEASFDPATDLVTFDNLEYRLNGWAGISARFGLSGVEKYYRDQTLDDLSKSYLLQSQARDAKESDGEDGNKPSNRGNPDADLKAMAAIYKGVGLLKGGLTLTDEGGLAKAAAMFNSVTNPKSAGSASRDMAAEARVQAKIRESWAAPMRQSAKAEARPSRDQQFLTSLANWIELGGQVVVSWAPTKPMDLGELMNAEALPPESNFSVTHQPPAKK